MRQALHKRRKIYFMYDWRRVFRVERVVAVIVGAGLALLAAFIFNRVRKNAR
jgi:hypothetical protein